MKAAQFLGGLWRRAAPSTAPGVPLLPPREQNRAPFRLALASPLEFVPRRSPAAGGAAARRGNSWDVSHIAAPAALTAALSRAAARACPAACRRPELLLRAALQTGPEVLAEGCEVAPAYLNLVPHIHPVSPAQRGFAPPTPLPVGLLPLEAARSCSPCGAVGSSHCLGFLPHNICVASGAGHPVLRCVGAEPGWPHLLPLLWASRSPKSCSGASLGSRSPFFCPAEGQLLYPV